MKNILIADKLPYLLTVLLGLVAYQINNLQILNSDQPILTYHYSKIKNGTSKGNNKQKINCVITNFNRTKQIDTIVLRFAYKTKYKDPKIIKSPTIISIAPSRILTNIAYKSSENHDIIEYTIPNMQPQTSYELRFNTLTNSCIKDYPNIYLSSTESIRLINSKWNFQIWLIKNQLLINIILLAIWLIFIALYLRSLKYLLIKTDKNEKST